MNTGRFINMGNWTYVGKAGLVCPNCGSEIQCEVRMKPKPNTKIR